MGALSISKAKKGGRRFLIDTNAVDIIRKSEAKSAELKKVRRADLYVSYATLIECLAGCNTSGAATKRCQEIGEEVTFQRAEEAPDVPIDRVLKEAFEILTKKRELFAAKGDSGIGDAYNAAMARAGNFVIVTTDPDYAKIDEIDWLEGWI